jgi:hypothetical protein
MRRPLWEVFWLIAAVLCCGSAFAQSLRITGLQPPSGPARLLIGVTGEGLTGAKIVWDAGLASEKLLPSALQGATMFSVPTDAVVGNHPVAVESVAGRSAPFDFVVVGNAPMAKPRIDHITLVETKFEADNKVRVVLYVQGPNIDVGAAVSVDGEEQASEAHKVLINDMFGANPAVLGFPIRHYLSRIVPLPARPAGSTIRVQVRNGGDETSAERDYVLPTDAATLDSDGDGIPDVIEREGYDNGNGRVDVKALGADPFRPDVFVEIDVMEDVTYRPIPAQGSRPGTFDLARSMFANAPVLNPFGPNGIHLFVDASGSVPHSDLLAFVPDDDPVKRIASFAQLRKAHFTPARRGLFHYSIWASSHPEGWSGESNIDFDGTRVGNGFFVSLAEFPVSYQTLKSQAATFVHELGHDLGQRHGGNNHSRYKPNYWSVMSYAWQLRTGHPNSSRMANPTCTQIYYGTPGALETNGAMPAVAGTAIDYSEGMGPTLTPNNGTLNEAFGVCGQPIDWDRDGKISKIGVNATIDLDNPADLQVTDYANWPNLLFDGPKLGGASP